MSPEVIVLLAVYAIRYRTKRIAGEFKRRAISEYTTKMGNCFGDYEAIEPGGRDVERHVNVGRVKVLRNIDVWGMDVRGLCRRRTP